MKDKILNFLKSKGYYLVLGLCVLTVGCVSFLSYRASQRKLAETPLNDPNTQGVEKVEENISDERQESSDNKEETKTPQAAAEYSAPIENGEIIAQYSPDKPLYSYTLKDWRTHNGIDIAAPSGTEVANVCEGVVETIEQDDLMGNMVTIRHTDGKVSRYASLATVSVEEGQLLKRGETIGTVGTSMLLECGETDHLHYELWNEDQPVEPSFLTD